jgi:hypothetical protein
MGVLPMFSRPRHFNSAEDLEQTLLRYVALYNHQLPQSALQSRTPMQAMKKWHQTHPDLFNKRPYDRPGCDISNVPPEYFQALPFGSSVPCGAVFYGDSFSAQA